MSSSIHDKLGRVRKPRVQISYEVWKDGAREIKELPFVVGVVGDFSGNPTEELKPLRDRNFVNIDRDNINEVMKKMTPGLNLRVKNTLAGDDSEMAVNLKFENIDDFLPANVAKQVDPLRKLLETRDKLQELLTKVDKSDKLEGVLEEILKNSDELQKASAEIGGSDDDSSSDSSSDEGGEQ